MDIKKKARQEYPDSTSADQRVDPGDLRDQRPPPRRRAPTRRVLLARLRSGLGGVTRAADPARVLAVEERAGLAGVGDVVGATSEPLERVRRLVAQIRAKAWRSSGSSKLSASLGSIARAARAASRARVRSPWRSAIRAVFHSAAWHLGLSASAA